MKRWIGWASLIVLIGLLILPVWGQTQHSITVAWTYTQATADLATGFNVYRSTIPGGPYMKLTATPLAITALSYVDASGTGGVKYFYVVTAVDATGSESAPSVEVSAIFLSNPAVPQGVTAIAK